MTTLSFDLPPCVNKLLCDLTVLLAGYFVAYDHRYYGSRCLVFWDMWTHSHSSSAGFIASTVIFVQVCSSHQGPYKLHGSAREGWNLCLFRVVNTPNTSTTLLSTRPIIGCQQVLQKINAKFTVWLLWANINYKKEGKYGIVGRKAIDTSIP